MLSPNAKRETTVVEEKAEGIRRDAKRFDGFLEATTEGLAFHDVLGEVAQAPYRGLFTAGRPYTEWRSRQESQRRRQSS